MLPRRHGLQWLFQEQILRYTTKQQDRRRALVDQALFVFVILLILGVMAFGILHKQ